MPSPAIAGALNVARVLPMETMTRDVRVSDCVVSGAPVQSPSQFTMWQLFKEFWLFLRQEKKWWLIPLVVLLLVLGALIVFSGGSVLAPLMYPFL